MAQIKKKLSKKAKEALQTLKESKLLNNSAKAGANPSQPKNVTADNAVKTSAANKMRPNKKRG